MTRVVFRERWGMAKFARHLDEVPQDGMVRAGVLSKEFCLSSAAAAGILIGRRGDFVKVEPGLWMKTDKNL